MSWWADLLIAFGAGLLLVWLALLAALLIIRPSRTVISTAARLLPDTLRLVTRLARDPTVPRGVRLRLWLLLGYLALPFDIVPDFLPVVGYADDAIIVVAVLRSVVRRAGIEPLHHHWPGSADGLAVVERIAGPTTRDV